MGSGLCVVAITLGLGILLGLHGHFVTRLLVVIWFDRAVKRGLKCNAS